MKAKIYVNGIGAVTTQGVWQDGIIADAQECESNVNYAVQPSYKELIAPAMIRRMSRGIKMGIFASQQALDNAHVTQPDAIITGTGLGCLEDSEKFLKSIIENEEQFLTPTNFIQSTHNTVGAQIALRLGCKGYNFTYVNGATSFESALFDALMQLETREANQILVGGIDELAEHSTSLLKLIHHIQDESHKEKVKDSISEGAKIAEGAVFFTLSNERNSHSKASVSDVSIRNTVNTEELESWVEDFLIRNNLSLSTVDAVIFGVNGDVHYDGYYRQFTSMFADSPQLYYKHLSGEYETASAFGMALAVKVIDEQLVPENIYWNNIQASQIKTILAYNQYRGRDHSLILLHHVETS